MKKTLLSKIPKNEPSAGGGNPPAPPVEEPGLKGKLEELHKGQTSRLDALFRGEDPVEEPEVKPEPPKEPEPEPKKPEPPKEPEVKPEPLKEGEEGDVNFDKPPEGTVPPTRESLAQQRAADNGRALKALETEHQETKLELQRIKDELEAAKKGGHQAPVSHEQFFSHPDVVKLREEVVTDLSGVVQTQPLAEAGEILDSRFGVYMADHIARSAETDQASARAMDAALKKNIADDFRKAFKESKGDSFDQDEMGPEMEQGAREYTREVVSLLVRNANKTMGIQQKVDELMSRAREGTLAQGVDVYKHHETDLGTALDAILEIPDDLITENPHTVESSVATLLKDKSWKGHYEKVRREILELTLGPRALTQQDIDGLKASGVELKEFQKKRQKAWLDKRRKLVPQIAQALLLRAVWEQTSTDAEAYRNYTGELNALSNGKDKKGDPKPKEEPPKPATEFVSACDGLLEESGYGKRR